MALTVYGGSVSPFVRKVRIVLNEKGVDYKLEQISPFSPPPEFKAISPLGRIPVLRDTDRPEPNTIPDSSVICDYLERKYPNPAVYPSDPFERARACWYEEYADSAMAQNIGRGLFFERIVKKMMKSQPDESICEKTLTKELPPLFDYVNGEIAGKDYLVGNTFSIADITVASMLVNFIHTGEKLDTARWPNLCGYIERLHARPSVKALIDEESPAMARLRAA
jgi:glutathione S-transferase